MEEPYLLPAQNDLHVALSSATSNSPAASGSDIVHTG